LLNDTPKRSVKKRGLTPVFLNFSILANSANSWIWNCAVVVFGLMVGSFLNVVIIRLPQGASINFPASHCPHCKKPIRWWDNLPLLSYVVLRGKCRSCNAKISIRYPLVEFLTALLFLAAKIHFGHSVMIWEFFLRDLPFLSILLAVTFIDLELRIIPDQLSLGGMAWGLLTSVGFVFFNHSGVGTSIGWVASLIGAAVGFGCFYGLAWIYLRLTGRFGLGGGDIKLLGMIGAFLGFRGVFTTVLVSSVIGSVVGISWALLQKRLKLSPVQAGESESLMLVSIPYGPFLVVGGLWHYFLSDLLWLQFMNPM
jgi:leader peptidase (prepilin peptidase) / N-methyltransferase